MRRPRAFFSAAVLMLACAQAALAQPVRIPVDPAARGYRTDSLIVDFDGEAFAAPWIVPGTLRLRIRDRRLPSDAYRVDHASGRILLYYAAPGDTLVAHYRQLAGAPRSRYALEYVRRDTSRREARARQGTGAPADAQAPDDATFESRLRRSGSVSRGVVAGSGRDVSLESGLRLELDGEITPGVTVRAALTDENTPILPEGTTQRLEEFDRVYIELAHRRGTARLGDFELALGPSAFGGFSRKLQGAAVRAELPEAGPLAGGGVHLAGASARGQFRVQEVQTRDGVQGPYRLEGDGGEPFILLVPGTEVVYLDGIRMERGETNDYVVDYATAEILFTARRVITSDRRVRVEFEYTTNQFSRGIVAARADAGLAPGRDGVARGQLSVTVIREADDTSLDPELGFAPADTALLARAGDGLAQRSGAERVVYDPEAPYVHYTREVDAAGDTIFVALSRAPLSDEPVYRVRFSRVGEGRGRYERAERTVNGIAYAYVGPGRGAFEPVLLLPKPLAHALVDLAGSWALVPGVQAYGEWSRSVRDENRLSALDDGDNGAGAWRGGAIVDARPIRLGDVALGRVSGGWETRRIGGDFEAFARIRPVEFERRWNLAGRVDATGGGGVDETAHEAFVRWDGGAASWLRVGGGRLDRGERFDGERLDAETRIAESGWPRIEYAVETIASRDGVTAQRGRWLRQRAAATQPLRGGAVTPGLRVEHERRLQRPLADDDSLLSASLGFVEVQPGIAWSLAGLRGAVEYRMRRDERPRDGRLEAASTGQILQSSIEYDASELWQTALVVGWQQRRFEERFRSDADDAAGGSLVAQWRGAARDSTGWASGTWHYEAQAERTPILQEIYVRTGTAYGEFVWVDGSGESEADGVIQVDEFIPERTPNEGEYVQTFVPGEELEAVVGTQARFSLALDPVRRFGKRTGRLARWASRMESRTTVEVRERSSDPAAWRIYALDLTRFRSARYTQTGRLRLAQDVELLPRHPRWGVSLSGSTVRALSRLATGLERRRLDLGRAAVRWRPGRGWDARVEAEAERNAVRSDSLSSRRYDIRSWAAEPGLGYRPAPAWYLTGSLRLSRKNDPVGERRAQIVRLPLEARWQRPGQTSLYARFELARTTIRGEARGLAAYELTDGRGAGTSMLWSVGGQAALSGALRATLAYDGRAPGDGPVLHTLRMQLTAAF